jgi:hypothetical protein
MVINGGIEATKNKDNRRMNHSMQVYPVAKRSHNEQCPSSLSSP